MLFLNYRCSRQCNLDYVFFLFSDFFFVTAIAVTKKFICL